MDKTRFINVCPQNNRRMEQFTQFTYYETENAWAFKEISKKQRLFRLTSMRCIFQEGLNGVESLMLFAHHC